MTILVKPGERIALDGIVVEGVSSIDQSLVTGESIPILRRPNDNVCAETLNLSGVLKVVVNKRAEDALVSRIVKLVVESRKRRHPSKSWLINLRAFTFQLSYYLPHSLPYLVKSTLSTVSLLKTILKPSSLSFPSVETVFESASKNRIFFIS